MVAHRVVSLKPKRPNEPTEHFVRLSRGENGSGFIVGYVDHTGTEDFRSQSEHQTYDEALKCAQRRAHDLRRTLKDETGVETVAEAKTKGGVADKSAAGDALPTLKPIDLVPLASHFKLPNLGDRVGDLDTETINERAVALYDHSRQFLAKALGDNRSTVQGQILDLFSHCTNVQAILYAYLERAFERIEQLEQAPKGMSYRGVYKAGEQYALGDVCTWSGSCWHCNEPTTERPDAGPWTLCVKRGRDGKDSRP